MCQNKQTFINLLHLIWQISAANTIENERKLQRKIIGFFLRKTPVSTRTRPIGINLLFRKTDRNVSCSLRPFINVFLLTSSRLTVFRVFLHWSMRTSGSEQRNLYRNENGGTSAKPTESCTPVRPWELFSRKAKVNVKNVPKHWFISTKSIRLWVSQAVLRDVNSYWFSSHADSQEFSRWCTQNNTHLWLVIKWNHILH